MKEWIVVSDQPYTKEQLKTMLEATVKKAIDKLPEIPYQRHDNNINFQLDNDGIGLSVGDKYYTEEEAVNILTVLARFYEITEGE